MPRAAGAGETVRPDDPVRLASIWRPEWPAGVRRADRSPLLRSD